MKTGQPRVKQIDREVFSKFKKVREQQSQLLGPHLLLSKNGLKYLGKQLPVNHQLSTTRNPIYPIFRFATTQTATFLFPLHGEPLAAILTKPQPEGQIQRWIEKCGSLENCLLEVLRKLLQLVEAGQEEIVLECLRVHNGELEYCYDNWLTPAAKIVINNPNQLENFYFSQEDLDTLKDLSAKKEKLGGLPSPNKAGVIYRVFLLVLHLGSHSLKERNYEFSGYRLNQQHLKLRLDYFCCRLNQRGLGDLLRKVITRQSTEIQEIWKICMPELMPKRVLTLSTANIPRKKHPTENSEVETDTPIKHSHINKLNCSIFSHSSNKSREDDSLLAYSLIKSNLVNDQNRSRGKSILKESRPNQKKNIKLRQSSSKDSRDLRQYQLFPPSKQRLNLKAILSASAELPGDNVKILKYLGLEEYVPVGLYEEKIIEVLGGIHVKTHWVKQSYENGSIYLGETAQGKKEGKGLYLFNSSDFYFGDWISNSMDGYGTYVFTSGEVYEGQLCKGFKQGHGRCIYPDGKSFEGFWVKNSKIGLGKVKFPNEVIFIGLFKPDCPETQGLFIGPMEGEKPMWENKGVLEHYHWQKNALIDHPKKEDELDRKSKLKHCRTEYYSQFTDDNGNRYEGEMVDGKKEGFGIFQTQADIYEGEWCEDKKFGKGQLYIKNMFHIGGEWKNNMLVRYSYSDGDETL